MKIIDNNPLLLLRLKIVNKLLKNSFKKQLNYLLEGQNKFLLSKSFLIILLH